MSNNEQAVEFASLDDIDFSGFTRLHVRDLTHPQKGWELVMNGVSVWAESTIDGDRETLSIFITDQSPGSVDV